MFLSITKTQRAFHLKKNGTLRSRWKFFVKSGKGHPTTVPSFILLHQKFLQFDWLRAVVFQLNLKYLHAKIEGNLLHKLWKLYINGTKWNVHLEIFSRPQAIENSRQYLLLWTDILKKTIIGCPWVVHLPRWSFLTGWSVPSNETYQFSKFRDLDCSPPISLKNDQNFGQNANWTAQSGWKFSFDKTFNVAPSFFL